MENATCGKGLAENAKLPAILAELVGTLAANLEAHLETLDAKDENARREHEVYSTLAREQRKISAELATTASRMASCRDLPMGAHHEGALTAPQILQAFEAFVKAKRELASFLERSAADDQRLLVQMAARAARA